MTGYVDSLLVFWSHHNGHSLIQHDLVGAVTVEVNTGHEGCLGGVCLYIEGGGGGGDTVVVATIDSRKLMEQ